MCFIQQLCKAYVCTYLNESRCTSASVCHMRSPFWFTIIFLVVCAEISTCLYLTRFIFISSFMIEWSRCHACSFKKHLLEIFKCLRAKILVWIRKKITRSQQSKGARRFLALGNKHAPAPRKPCPGRVIASNHTDPRGSQLQLRDHCCVNKVSIDHQSDLNGIRCEGEDVRKSANCKHKIST